MNLKHTRTQWTAAVGPHTLMEVVCESLSGRTRSSFRCFAQLHDGGSVAGPGENSAPGVAHHQSLMAPGEAPPALAPPHSRNNDKLSS